MRLGVLKFLLPIILKNQILQMNRFIPLLDKIIQFSLVTFAVSSLFSISVTQISFGIGSLSWLLKTQLTRTWNEVRVTLVGIALFVFCLAYIISLTTAVDIDSSIEYIKKLLQVIIFFWVANTVQDEKQRNILVSLVIFAAVISAVNGIYWEAATGRAWIRQTGTMSTASTFAGLLMLTGLVALGKFFFNEPKEPKNYWLLAGIAFISVCLILVLARQAWLGFLVGSIFLAYFWRKIFLWIIPLILVSVFLMSPQTYQNRIKTMLDIKNDTSLNIRIEVWKTGWEIFKDSPITGCGYKCVDSVHTSYPDPTGYVALNRGMHSNSMQLLIDTGLLGFGAWLSIWGAYFIAIFKRYQELTREKTLGNNKGTLLGCLAAVLGFLVGGFFESSFYDSEVVMLVYFLMGISLAKVKNVPEVSTRHFLPNIRSLDIDDVVPILDKLIQFSLYTFVIFCTLSISVTQISFAIGVLAWLTKVHLTHTWNKIYRTSVGLPILCFCLASILAVITSVDYAASLSHLKKIFQFAILFWVANTVTNEKQKDLLIKLLIISGVIAAIIGFSQAWSTAVTLQTRVAGTMSVYMTFAGILMLVGLIASGRYLFNDTKEKWVMVATGIIIFCLLLTLTRQAWLGFFVGFLVLIIFYNKKYLLAIPFAIIGLLLFAPESIKDRMLSLIDLSDWTFQARIFLWQGGLEIFKDHPITGCGFKCVDVLHTQYPDPSGYIARHRGMHNNIIQLLVDTGILGLATWLSIWAYYFLAIYKQLNKKIINSVTKGLVIGSLAAVISFLVGGMFETNFYDSEVVMLLYFIMGLAIAETSKKVGYKNNQL